MLAATIKYLLIFVITAILYKTAECKIHGVNRPRCSNREGFLFKPHSVFRHRLHDLRNEMRIRASVQSTEIDAYILTSFDEHQNEDVADADRRREFITGFTGTYGDAVITLKNAAMWTDSRYIAQADAELDCEWLIFDIGKNIGIADWLDSVLPPDSRVGADPYLIPHYLWDEWDAEFSKRYLQLVKINRNLVDIVWADARPAPTDFQIKVHPLKYAGERWISKIGTLRSNLSALNCDAMVVTSLTEIAYILNLRGNDIPYTPVFKAYLVVTINEIFLYTNKTRTNDGTVYHLKDEPCLNADCVHIKNYNEIWQDLRTLSQQWRRVLLPATCVYDMGVSEAIYTSVPKHIIVERISPIIYMRAQKNEIEREGMKTAHIRDGAAMCDFLSYFEQRFKLGEQWTELQAAAEVDRSRRAQVLNHGLSFQTIVAFGEHGSLPHYVPSARTNVNITDQSTVVIDSGGQYFDGTTDVTRTLHFGKPTVEQKKAYTAVLSGMIKLAMLHFPEHIKPAEVDALARGPIWGFNSDYPHGTGHGIGSFLSVHESPINIAYNAKQKHTFKDGYFFSNEPGFYKKGDFGVRLENVLEVMSTGKRTTTNYQFLSFNDITYVPFEPSLIDRTMLSAQEKRWLNDYNSKIREFVGAELKKQLKFDAFYWMMNKTGHVIEYLPQSDYRSSNSNDLSLSKFIIFISSVFFSVHIGHFRNI